MTVEATSSPSFISGLVGTIRKAAQAAGASFEHLLATARVESGLNTAAQAPTSSARGLFQFIDQTWLATMKDAGPALGYARYADAIDRTASGAYVVPDPAARAEIMALRDDPAASTAMAGAFTQGNAETLARQLGRSATGGELYIAHFLGAGGAGRLITLAANEPDASAAAAFPQAAAANRSIFYDRQGSARGAADVYQRLVGRYESARAAVSGVTGGDAQVALAGTRPAPIASSTTLEAADGPPLTLGDSGPAFHGLFRTSQQRTVAPVVAALWSSPTIASSQSQPATTGGTLDLFREDGLQQTARN